MQESIQQLNGNQKNAEVLQQPAKPDDGSQTCDLAVDAYAEKIKQLVKDQLQ